MLMAFWIDVDEMTIPDGVTIPGTLAGLVILTLWPFAFLPDSFEVPSGFLAEPMLTSVWLTSPDEVPLLPDNLAAMPRIATVAAAGMHGLARLGRGYCGLLCLVSRPDAGALVHAARLSPRGPGFHGAHGPCNG